MNTKEAIEFIGDVLIVADIKEYDFDDSPGLVDRLQNLHIEDNLKEIIELLKQDEKYKQMWEELEELIENNTFLFTYDVLLRNMKSKLKQKYFPKEVNK